MIKFEVAYLRFTLKFIGSGEYNEKCKNTSIILKTPYILEGTFLTAYDVAKFNCTPILYSSLSSAYQFLLISQRSPSMQSPSITSPLNKHILMFYYVISTGDDGGLVMSNYCNSMDYSLPGSSVHGISQARILEWVATSFSR